MATNTNPQKCPGKPTTVNQCCKFQLYLDADCLTRPTITQETEGKKTPLNIKNPTFILNFVVMQNEGKQNSSQFVKRFSVSACEWHSVLA